MAKRRKNVIKFKKKPRAAIVIFIILLIYLIAFSYIYISKNKIRTYEVNIGSLTSNSLYTGIAIRNETVFNSEYAGNINYYQREDTKVKVGDTIYTVDEGGRVAQILTQQNTDKTALSKEDLTTIKTTLNNFKVDYDSNSFHKVYELKNDLNIAVTQSRNENILSNLDSIVNSTGSQNLFRVIKADTSGLVEYHVDGFEDFSEDRLSPSIFDKNSYQENKLKTEELVSIGNPAYKLVKDENWAVYIPLSEDDISKYDLKNQKKVKIKFTSDNLTVNTDFSLVENNGTHYGKFSLNQYMIRYAKQRFLDIELVSENDSGLKIPVTSMVQNDFYVIPKEYLTSGGNSNASGFLYEYNNSDGSRVTDFKAVNLYQVTDTECYVSTNDFSPGDTIIKTDSSQKYTIGQTEKLTGVYSVNAGYTVFRRIEILKQNNEYCIVKKGTSYGLSVYDRIVLDSTNVKQNQIIY